jgi:lipopolysaccharide/colanic/teichoic acid biosynthesis glycosyltransferase
LGALLTGEVSAPEAPPREIRRGTALRPRRLCGRQAAALDASALICAYGAALLFVDHWTIGFLQRPEKIAVIGSSIALWIVLFCGLGLYRRSLALVKRDEIYYVVSAFCLGIIPQLALFFVNPQYVSRAAAFCALAGSFVVLGATRLAGPRIRTAAAPRRVARYAVVGTGARTDLVARALSRNERCEVVRFPVGAIDSFSALNWCEVAKHSDCGTLVLTEPLPVDAATALLETASRMGIKVGFAPPPRVFRPVARVTKRAFDVVLSALLLVIFAPVMGVIALRLRAAGEGPVLYRQERVKRHGQRFAILKFRTMRVEAERETGPVWAGEADRRVTRFGAFLRRTHLDELPQLLQVLRGDMSLVGPRPERPVFCDRFRRFLPRYDDRHLVRPGLASLSHVHMADGVDQSEIALRLEYDLYYIEHWTLLMDLSILAKTFVERFL